MSSSMLKHFSHPEHLLVLKEDDVIEENAKCCVCNRSVIGSLTYTCSSDSVLCQGFYLHRTCAELPKQINHHKHAIHPLVLSPRQDWLCEVCASERGLFSYTCDNCEFDVCVFCAFEQRVLWHPGHPEHSLTLMRREAWFKCDVCGEEARDSSYSCNPCEFWIHKKCALSPFVIAAPAYHHHPLELVYSIPEMHRYFDRYCLICLEIIQKYHWLYCCHKCTCFVHIRCATSPYSESVVAEIEANGANDDHADLVEFPLPSEESLFEFIKKECCKLHVGFHGESESLRKIEHWSHEHPLELLQFSVNDDDKRVLICDGCIQPITASNPCYYTCIECGFFLHSFCADKLPQELPAGASPFHPQHSLFLRQTFNFYSFVTCDFCRFDTNGFYYLCETCDIEVDIRCAFLPARIRHKSHKHHALVQRHFSDETCTVSRFIIQDCLGYACETCSSFQISINCLFYPSILKHRYDDHPTNLMFPPFFYEGVFYCEICEEQVNNQFWLYHCGECDYSFHDDCLHSDFNVKLGGTIRHSIGSQQHTLALVFKKNTRKKHPWYNCGICGVGYNFQFFFECDGCGYLACIYCVRNKNGW